jgi:hypothetical protein
MGRGIKGTKILKFIQTQRPLDTRSPLPFSCRALMVLSYQSVIMMFLLSCGFKIPAVRTGRKTHYEKLFGSDKKLFLRVSE